MVGIIRIIVGLFLLVGGASLGIAWIIFCFGTVIVGIVLLIFAPQVLIAPLFFFVALGMGTINAGLEQFK
jgi:hypothetical protein